MSALIRKDFYVLLKQVGIFLVLVLILSAIPSFFNNIFAVIYAAMLPYTAMAYDERSKWDQMAAMLPYSARDIVLSKYVFGWLCIGVASVLTMVIQTVLGALVPAVNYRLTLSLVFLAFCGAATVLSLTLPLMFRFGVEKGRLAMFLIIFLVCGGSGALASVANNPNVSGLVTGGPLLALLPLLALAVTAVSIPLSMKFYRRRMRG